MSLKEWQIKLRVQAADKDNFSITGNGNGEFVVSNYSTSHKYEVVWKGLGHPLNRCSCMEFRTSHLMTCKHLEAVKKHIIFCGYGFLSTMSKNVVRISSALQTRRK